MSNCEKKLDALIDASGFDVEEVTSRGYGEAVRLGLMAVGCAGMEWEYFPDEQIYREVIRSVDYKLTKRKPWVCDSGDKFTDTSKGVITYVGGDAALELLKEIIDTDSDMFIHAYGTDLYDRVDWLIKETRKGQQ